MHSNLPKLITRKCYLWMFLVLCLCVDFNDTLSTEFEPGGKPQIKVFTPGAELVLGAVVNVRERGPGLVGCGEKRLEGVTTVDALAWAVEELNGKIWSGYSSNISIGLYVMDSCGRSRTAASQIGDLFPELKGEDDPLSFFKFGLIDDVGLEEDEADVSKALDDSKIPVVRTNVNMDSPQDTVKSLLAFVGELQWEQVAVVHTNSRYSLSMLKAFTKSVKKANLCVPWISAVDEAETDLTDILKSGIPIIALLPSEEQHHLFARLNDLDKRKRKIPILFSDLILRSNLKGKSVKELQLLSMIGLPEKEIRFEEYYSKNSIMTGVRTEDELELVQRTRIVRKIKHITEAFSLRLGRVVNELCYDEKGFCPELITSEARTTLKELMSGIDWSTRKELYVLMEYQFQFADSHVHLHRMISSNYFGNIEVFESNLPNINANCNEGEENTRPECRCLEVKNVRSGGARHIDDRGRKKLNSNLESEYVYFSTPDIRPVDQASTTPSIYSALRDPINAAIGVLTLIGALLTLFTGQYFATSAALPNGGLTTGTSVIGYYILTGLFFLYSTNLSFVLTPSNSSCGVRRFCPSFFYAVVFSGMLIKVWTSWKQTKSEKAETWTPWKLILLSLSFSVLQALLSGTWLMLVPPRSHYEMDKWICYPSGDLDSHLLVSMVYVVGLLFATSVLAIRTCSQTNNSEARWILISSALVAIVFSCWGISVATGVWQMQRTPFTNLVAATTLLFCLYIPKIKLHSRLRKAQPNIAQYPVEVDKEYPLYAARTSFPVMLDCNLPNISDDLNDSAYSNQAYSIDGGTESMSIPFELDASSFSEPEHEQFTFSTFLDDQPTANPLQTEFVNDPTQVVPSALYPLDMFSTESDSINEHYHPGTNEFTPAHRTSSQMYLYPEPEWVP